MTALGLTILLAPSTVPFYLLMVIGTFDGSSYAYDFLLRLSNQLDNTLIPLWSCLNSSFIV
jgi:hypothetical protein